MMRRPRSNTLGCAVVTYSQDEATRAYVRLVAEVKFKGNCSKALRFLVATAGSALETEEARV
jgi:hypothetical protein